MFTESGGIEVARTEERMEELQRRMASAQAWGVDRVSMVTPAEIKELVPFIDESILLGGFYSPGRGRGRLAAGRHDHARAGGRGRRAHDLGQHRGARDRRRARPRAPGAHHPRRHRDRGRGRRLRRLEPAIARMAGASIPLTPAVHQMIDIGPVPRFASSTRHIEYPIVRDMDTFMYERQDGIGLEIGSYAHRPILHDPEEIPSIEQAALSPTELPFTQDDFDQQMEHALELMPEIVGDESVGVKYAINGLLSLTPDGMPLLGETHEVRGPVVVRRRVGQGGAGHRRGGRRVDDARRVGDRPALVRHRPLLRAPEDPRPRPRPRVGGLQQDLRHRPPRPSSGPPTATCGCRPSTPASRSWARCSSRPPAGSARTGTSRTRRCSRSTATASTGARPSGTRAGGRRSSTPSTWRCATAPAWSTCSAFAIFDVPGPGALEAVQRVAVRQMDVRGRPRRLHAGADAGRRLQVRPHDHAAGRRGVPRRHRRRPRAPPTASGSPTTCPRTAPPRSPTSRRPGRRSASGGRARVTSSRSLTRDDVSHEGFRFGSCRTIEIDTLRVLASRISYVGDLGWELYVPIEQGQRLWDMVWEAGRPHGIVPVGIGVYGTTGRLEKCYRAYGFELESEYNVVRGGHGRAEGEGRGLRRQGGAPPPPRRAAGRDHVHADRRRPHVGLRA